MIIKQVLLAINYMHSEKIVHRDLKPENILLTGEAAAGVLNIKLTDFGLATPFKEGKKLKEVIGSPIYMAPEIVKQEKYDEKIDIWGIGIIAHIVLCGCPPFEGTTGDQVQNAIISGDPTFVNAKVKSSLTQEAIDFTMKCLSKNPNQRPPAYELLRHPWLQENVRESEIDSEAA